MENLCLFVQSLASERYWKFSLLQCPKWHPTQASLLGSPVIKMGGTDNVRQWQEFWAETDCLIVSCWVCCVHSLQHYVDWYLYSILYPRLDYSTVVSVLPTHLPFIECFNGNANAILTLNCSVWFYVFYGSNISNLKQLYTFLIFVFP